MQPSRPPIFRIRQAKIIVNIQRCVLDGAEAMPFQDQNARNNINKPIMNGEQAQKKVATWQPTVAGLSIGHDQSPRSFSAADMACSAVRS